MNDLRKTFGSPTISKGILTDDREVFVVLPNNNLLPSPLLGIRYVDVSLLENKRLETEFDLSDPASLAEAILENGIGVARSLRKGYYRLVANVGTSVRHDLVTGSYFIAIGSTTVFRPLGPDNPPIEYKAIVPHFAF